MTKPASSNQQAASKQAASKQAASKQQQASSNSTHFCLNAYLCQHRRDIAQTFMADSPSETLQTHKFLGRNSPRGRIGGQKSLKNPQNPEKLSPGQGGEYWGGRPLWDISTYLHQHRRDITQTFMVDSPSDALQTHKVSGQTSRGGRAGG